MLGSCVGARVVGLDFGDLGAQELGRFGLPGRMVLSRRWRLDLD